MTDELKPVPCGCGGEAMIETVTTRFEQKPRFRIICEKCKISTIWDYFSETEAITAWNRAMGNRLEFHTVERTAKVKTVTANNGHTWIECSRCHQEVRKGFPYCAGCGARLEWE